MDGRTDCVLTDGDQINGQTDGLMMDGLMDLPIRDREVVREKEGRGDACGETARVRESSWGSEKG